MSKISDAIAAVMADIKRLEKGDKNAHGGYKFASIDDFLDLTRPLCAKHKLAVFQDEVSCEVIETRTSKGPQQTLFMRFAFKLECGDETRGPHHRSIMVPASMGSQAFGSAQSYALKQYLRATLQIATGDTDDIDHHNTGELGSREPIRPVLIDDGTRDQISTLAAAAGVTLMSICKGYKVESLIDLTVDQGAATIKALKARIEKAKPANEFDDLGGDGIPNFDEVKS